MLGQTCTARTQEYRKRVGLPPASVSIGIYKNRWGEKQPALIVKTRKKSHVILKDNGHKINVQLLEGCTWIGN